MDKEDIIKILKGYVTPIFKDVLEDIAEDISKKLQSSKSIESDDAIELLKRWLSRSLAFDPYRHELERDTEIFLKKLNEQS